MKQALLGYSIVSCKSSLLGCFVIDVAIVLFNKKGLVTLLDETFFAW